LIHALRVDLVTGLAASLVVLEIVKAKARWPRPSVLVVDVRNTKRPTDR
jgi:hypothetical protein